MEALKIFDRKPVAVDWEYDRDADSLYLSFGKPRPATGVDIGHGVVVRYDERAREVVGLTVVGLRSRIEEFLRPPARRRRSTARPKTR